jgi:branched-chain amino acid transport system permease protein
MRGRHHSRQGSRPAALNANSTPPGAIAREIGGTEVSSLYADAIIAGLAQGGIYALIAIGITQTYRVTRVLNFAHAGFVLWAAYLYSWLAVDHHWPILLAAGAAIGIVAAGGLVTQIVIFRFASNAGAPQKLIITLGLLQLLTAAAVKVYSDVPRLAPSIFPTSGFSVAGARVTWEQVSYIGLAAIAIILLELGSRYTRLGLLTRAVVEDPTMAQVLGTRRDRVGAVNWTIAAALAGVAGVMLASIVPFTADLFLGYVVVAFAASVLGGLQSLVLSAAGGMLLGVVYNVTSVRFNAVGAGTLAIFVVAFVGVMLRRRWPGEAKRMTGTDGRIANTRVWWIAGGVNGLAALALLIAVCVSQAWTQTGALIVVYSVAAYSLVPIIGWTGQLSLAQGGIMGVSAYTMAALYNSEGLSLGFAVAAGVGVGLVAGLLVGICTARLPFALTALITLLFTSAVAEWLLYRPEFKTLSGVASLVAPSFMTSSQTSMFWIFVAAMSVVVLFLWNVRRSSHGVRMLGVRTSPIMMRHFGVRPLVTQTAAFALSGGIAGLAGIMLLLLLGAAEPVNFDTQLSLVVLTYAVVGGVAKLRGPILGTLGFIGGPQLLGLAKYGNSQWPQLFGGAATADLVARHRDGLVSLTTRRPGAGRSRPPVMPGDDDQRVPASFVSAETAVPADVLP